jgi:hypothetical protein
MEERVVRAATDRGVTPDGIARLVESHRAAMEPREAAAANLTSDQDPEYLHPGRVSLILLTDLGEVDPDVLAAGACAESRVPALRIPTGVAQGVLGEAAFAHWRALPDLDWACTAELGHAELLEGLVTASGAVQKIALAEALDQIRHAHLWTDSTTRAQAAHLAKEVLAPAASRVHPVLERRFNWWVRRVGESFSFRQK